MIDWDRTEAERYRSRVRGCLVGGAVGDALGAPIEFLSLDRIRERYGPAGLTDLVVGADAVAPVTDDTQMTLFTVEGLIRASVRWDRGVCHPPSVVHRAYLRWLDTQRLAAPPRPADGWLAAQPWLYARRAPGNACLSGLESPGMGTPDDPKNPDSKGCGTVMRSAPFGLDPREWATPERAFDLAVECATQTHGHPTGYLAAGAFAAIVRALVAGRDLRAAVAVGLDLLAGRPGHEETTAALRAALAATGRPPAPDEVERLGGAWIAEEALAIGVYCALSYPDPADVRKALLLSVNHSGDSDSTGSVCGNLLGAWHGETALPPDWAAVVEGRGTILALADDLAMEYTQGGQLHGDHGPHTAWTRRYPGA
ncbi:ADP-ribosylglycohydrolase family protein [Phytohabitans kaempferiae]|uniref:ADP-ribosylglycohydrolase family protein n=1 Tax=Phytohabitans kaempferiae TaxID=1620943 RepID=A0ABV6LYS8_9ACTN